MGMWESLSKDSLIWDNSIYANITNVAAEIKKGLEIAKSGINDEKATINKLIDKANGVLEKNNYGGALSIYSEIISIRDRIPDTFFEEKKEINKQILPFYSKLTDRIDSKFVEDFHRSIKKADSLVSDSFSSIEKGSIENAKNCYGEALETYKNLPHGFLMVSGVLNWAE